MTVKILYGENIINSEWQTKTFKDEMAAVEWCRRNAKKIVRINDLLTGNQPVSHFDVMDALRGY